MKPETTEQFIESNCETDIRGKIGNVSSLSFVLAIFFGGQSPPFVSEKLKVKS